MQQKEIGKKMVEFNKLRDTVCHTIFFLEGTSMWYINGYWKLRFNYLVILRYGDHTLWTDCIHIYILRPVLQTPNHKKQSAHEINQKKKERLKAKQEIEKRKRIDTRI